MQGRGYTLAGGKVKTPNVRAPVEGWMGRTATVVVPVWRTTVACTRADTRHA